MRVSYNQLFALLSDILIQVGLKQHDAEVCAGIFTDNTRDGISSHGVNRFPRFVSQISNGIIQIDNKPEQIGGFGGVERWDGRHGIGPLNACFCIDRAMALAEEHGIGAVALRNTTHWMRGGTYGLRAAERGFYAICWTNTMPNMPPWGATRKLIGNNPIVFALPGEDHPYVLDMAVSQYSYGKLETLRTSGEKLPYPGGFDQSGTLTTDPDAILKTERILPAGMWKGAGLSMILDLFAATLSLGSPTIDIPRKEDNASQMFIALHPGTEEHDQKAMRDIMKRSVTRTKEVCAEFGEEVHFPGEGVFARRKQSDAEGIFVHPDIWNTIESLRSS